MTEPTDLIEESPEIHPPAIRRYRRAIIISVFIHVVGLTALLFWFLPSKHDQTKASPIAASQASSAPPPANSDVPKPIENPEIPADQIQASIESQMEAIATLPDERKLSELEKNLKRLDAIATDESVRKVTSTIADTLGLKESYVPKEASPEGTFDTHTAQLSDVTRSRDADGRWQYESVLVDAEGRTLKVPMSGTEGQTAYDTFEQLRKFPMAAGIYRSVVMPMMQKMIEASDLVDKAAVEADRINQTPVESSEAGNQDARDSTSE